MPPRTFTERARREQLVAVTVALVAEHGHAGLSLQRIADAAGLSKAAVLYYFPGKDAVLAAAYRTVTDELVAHVGAAVEAAPGPAAKVEASVDALLAFVAVDDRRPRLLAAALAGPGTDDRPSSPRRWEAMAGLIADAQAAGEIRADVDPRLAAIMIGGTVDAVVAASLEDPGIRLDAARPEVLGFVRRALGL